MDSFNGIFSNADILQVAISCCVGKCQRHSVFLLPWKSQSRDEGLRCRSLEWLDSRARIWGFREVNVYRKGSPLNSGGFLQALDRVSESGTCYHSYRVTKYTGYLARLFYSLLESPGVTMHYLQELCFPASWTCCLQTVHNSSHKRSFFQSTHLQGCGGREKKTETCFSCRAVAGGQKNGHPVSICLHSGGF